jgi:hypothetical protein
MRAARSKENEVLLLLHKTTEPLSIADIASRLKWLTSSGPTKQIWGDAHARTLARRQLGEAGQKVVQRLAAARTG